MLTEREKIINRILQILSFIDKEGLVVFMKKIVNLFSEKELTQLLEFLEKWDYSKLYDLLQIKINEYKTSLDKIKMLKLKVKTEKKQFVETKEREIEKAEAENLINF